MQYAFIVEQLKLLVHVAFWINQNKSPTPLPPPPPPPKKKTQQREGTAAYWQFIYSQATCIQIFHI